MPMKLIVGLGNPEPRYRTTRHNAGFLFADHLLAQLGDNARWEDKPDFQARIAAGELYGQRVTLALPQTYMNASGLSVRKLVSFFKLEPERDVLVVHDDVDLPLGEYRITSGSRAAGHNGVQSVIDALGTQGFRRIRIGVESRTSRAEPPTETFVLQPFSDQQLEVLYEQVFPGLEREVKTFLSGT